jgi:hypothetical protein
MSYNIILNSSNVSNNTNSQYTYNFINGSFKIKEGSEICVSEIQVPYSWFNITTLYNNNTFQIIDWLGTTHNIVLPNGFYQVSDIFNYLQEYFINNGMYLITATGENYFFFQIYTNLTYYNNQMLFYPCPTSLPTGYTQPSNFIGYPTTSKCIQFVVLNNAFQTNIGFSHGTYGGGSSNLSVSSNMIPDATTVNSIVVRCSLVENPIGFPTDILDSFAVNATFGSNINYQPTYEKWIKIKPGTYSNLVLTLTDQNYNTLYANDDNVCISLILREKINKFII